MKLLGSAFQFYSVLNITNLDGNREHFEATASISLLSAKTTVQMPIGQMGSLSGSLRRTYFDKTVAPFLNNIPNYYFLDGNVKAFFDFDNKNKVTVSGYGSTDNLDLTFNPKAQNKAGITYDWGNRTGSIRWTRIFSPQLFANFWLTGSRFNSQADFSQAFDEVYVEKNLTPQDVIEDFEEWKYNYYWIHNRPPTAGESMTEIRSLYLYFYTRYRIIIYAADRNFRDFHATHEVTQGADGNHHEPAFHIDGDGIGAFGSAVVDTAYFEVLRE